jgi:formate dehydrogenase major subunit
VPGLGTSFGRGGATTAQQDLVNADAILIIGSSMAEAHPVGFRWVVKAREEHDALVIHVDPRFSRTSALADIWVPIRAGSDILFFGGLINYVLTQDRAFREYVVAYTNAPILVREDFEGPEALDGFFSGWQPDRQAYDTATWQYDVDERGRPKRDDTLTHPRSIYQQLVRHFARYTPEMVERACGIPREHFVDLADRYTACSGPDRTATICYAVGLTQHSVGVQIVRSAAILQLSWATSAVLAAVCSRSEDTPRSKDRPTFRRSSTCCPDICRCLRTERRPRRSSGTSSGIARGPVRGMAPIGIS